jgi:NAD(P)H-hydrate epimerase
MPVTCEEMREAEEAAFSRGVSAEALMEQAGLRIADVVTQFHPAPGVCTAFCGKGNNAGDALVALRHLRTRGWRICTRLAFDSSVFSSLAAKKFFELGPTDGDASATVVLDGLLGIGARGAPSGEIASAIEELNTLRLATGAWVLAIDIPSGLGGDAGKPAEPCVRADLTATIGRVKQGLLADSATDHVGRLALVPLDELGSTENDGIATSLHLRKLLPPRHFDTHKGEAGRIGIIAGSIGLTGAARLCSEAAVRAGGGLVTLYVNRDVYPILATNCAPEVMVKPVESLRDAVKDRLDVLAIGPGLGSADAVDVVSLIHDTPIPVVVDADALNALSRQKGILRHMHGPRLLTPHPGEMERLSPQKGRTRSEWAKDFVEENPVTLLLKGARTIVSDKSRASYNTTGHPGMASGGMGDVLTGVCAALTAQVGGHSMYDAATLGAWVCGFAAERAVFHGGRSQESLSAHDVIAHLGEAFDLLRRGAY